MPPIRFQDCQNFFSQGPHLKMLGAVVGTVVAAPGLGEPGRAAQTLLCKTPCPSPSPSPSGHFLATPSSAQARLSSARHRSESEFEVPFPCNTVLCASKTLLRQGPFPRRPESEKTRVQTRVREDRCPGGPFPRRPESMKTRVQTKVREADVREDNFREDQSPRRPESRPKSGKNIWDAPPKRKRRPSTNPHQPRARGKQQRQQ